MLLLTSIWRNKQIDTEYSHGQHMEQQAICINKQIQVVAGCGSVDIDLNK